MVEYVIKSTGKEEGGIEEWSIVELQGEIEIRNESRDEASFDGKYFGDLHFDQRGNPVLILGNLVYYKFLHLICYNIFKSK